MKKKHRRFHASGAVSQMIAAMSSEFEHEPCNTCGNCALVRYDTIKRCESCGEETPATATQMH